MYRDRPIPLDEFEKVFKTVIKKDEWGARWNHKYPEISWHYAPPQKYENSPESLDDLGMALDYIRELFPSDWVVSFKLATLGSLTIRMVPEKAIVTKAS